MLIRFTEEDREALRRFDLSKTGLSNGTRYFAAPLPTLAIIISPFGFERAEDLIGHSYFYTVLPKSTVNFGARPYLESVPHNSIMLHSEATDEAAVAVWPRYTLSDFVRSAPKLAFDCPDDAEDAEVAAGLMALTY